MRTDPLNNSQRCLVAARKVPELERSAIGLRGRHAAKRFGYDMAATMCSVTIIQIKQAERFLNMARPDLIGVVEDGTVTMAMAMKLSRRSRDEQDEYIKKLKWPDLVLGSRGRRLSHDGRTSYVYFVQSEGGGPIKIGRSVSPVARISTMQQFSPFPLRLIGLMNGNCRVESDLHRRFAGARLHGEWFEPTDELAGFINENAFPDLEGVSSIVK